MKPIDELADELWLQLEYLRGLDRKEAVATIADALRIFAEKRIEEGRTMAKKEIDLIKEARMLFAKLDEIHEQQKALSEREGVIRNELQRLYNLGIDKHVPIY